MGRVNRLLSFGSLLLALTLSLTFSRNEAIATGGAGDPGDPAGLVGLQAGAGNGASGVGNSGVIENDFQAYTGGVGFVLPLTTVKGRAGLDLSVAMSYSSHVQQVANAEDYESQTSWVGLGWTLSYGSIVANHNNTRDINDDEYTMITEDGSAHRLIQSARGSNDFYLEDYRYWKITRVLGNYGGVSHTWGWIIKREDGTVYKYGDMGDDTPNPDIHNASRWRVCWGDFSGLGSDLGAGHESLYEYEWDLWKVTTPRGDQSITFWYAQNQQWVISSPPGGPVDSSSHKYTRASYLDKITLPNGRYVTFTREPRTDFERYFSDDLHQQLYDTLRLDYVEVFDSLQNRSLKIDISYTTSSGEPKLLLAGVQISDGGSTSLPAYSFSYASQDPNRLALNQITYPSGGVVSYSYDTVDASANMVRLQRTLYRIYGQVGNQTGYYRRAYWGSDGAGARGWTKDDSSGVDAIVWNGYWQYLKGKWAYSSANGDEDDVDGDVSNRILAYTNMETGAVIARLNRGGEWDSTVIVPSPAPTVGWNSSGEWNWTMVGPDYVAVLQALRTPDSINLAIFKLDPSQTNAPVGWRKQTIFWRKNWTTHAFDSYSQSQENDANTFTFMATPGFFAMMFEFALDAQHNSGRTCIAAKWTDTSWVESDMTGSETTTRWAAGGDYMAVINDTLSFQSRVKVFQATGSTIAETSFTAPYRLIRPVSGPDYFVASAYNTGSYFKPGAYAIKYNGTSWVGQDLGFLSPVAGGTKEDIRRIGVANDWFVLAKHKDTTVGPLTGWNRYANVYTWNGITWSSTNLLTLLGVGGDPKLFVTAGSNVVAMYYQGDFTSLRVSRRMSSSWSAVETIPRGTQTFWTVAAGHSYVAVNGDDECPGSMGEALYYTGGQWRDRGSLEFGNDNGGGYGNYGQGFDRGVTTISDECITNNWILEVDKWHAGFCNDAPYDTVVYFALASRSADDRMGNVGTTSYSYWGGILDPSGVFGRFRKVTVKGPYVSSPGAKDYTTTWFYNDWDDRDSSVAPNLDGIAGGYHLDGLPLRITRGSAVTGIDSNWVINEYSVVQPRPQAYTVRLTRTIETSDGVANTIAYAYHSAADANDNGLPVQVTRAGSRKNGVHEDLVEQTTYAHEAAGADTTFRTHNAITLPFETRMRDSVTTLGPVLSKSRITYDVPGAGGWTNFMPKARWAYRWSTVADSFKTLDSTETADGINPAKELDANGIAHSRKIGCGVSLPIAEVSNARPAAWAMSNFESLDQEPSSYGWPKFQYSGTSTSTVFTGRRSAYFTKAGGPSELGPHVTLAEDPGRDTLIFDSWMKSNVSAGKAGLVCRVYDSPSHIVFNDSVGHPGDGGAAWQHLQLVVNLTGFTINHIDCEVRVFEQASVGQWAYVDDCRVTPFDALMTTRCYDPTNLALLAEAGPDNIPTKHVYDALGRLVETRNYKDERLESRSYSLSRDESGGTFVPDSNYVKITTYRGSLDSDSTLEVSYLDGFGRTIQRRVRSTDAVSEQYIVTLTSYDVRGHAAKSYKPYYASGYAYSGNAVSLCTNYYDGDPGPDCLSRPYSETEYFDDPLGRLKRVGSPGASYSLDSTHTIRYTYGSNSSNEVSGYADAAELYKATVTDEDGRNSYRYVDKLGRTIAEFQDSSGTKIGWVASYHILGGLLSRTDARGLSSQRNYDSLGQLIRTSSADVAGHWMLYDRLGRLRLDKDSAFSTEHSFVYYKYDSHGRRTEWGRVIDEGLFNQQNADNQAFPTASYVTEYSSVYDGPTRGGGIVARGKLVHTSDRLGGTRRAAVYEAFGRMSAETVYVSALPVKTLQYQYNRAGQLTQETNVDGVTVNYTYDKSGRLDSIKESSSVLASHTYWPTGAVRVATLRKDGTTSAIQNVDYGYNSRDWLVGINDQATMDTSGTGDRFSLRIGYDSVDASGFRRYSGIIPQVVSRRRDRGAAVIDSLKNRFAYDGLGRMSGNFIFANGTYAESESLNYDRNSNTTRRVIIDNDLVEMFCYEATSNRMTSKGISCPGATSYTYDLDGQLRTRDTKTFHFSWRNLLGSYEIPHGSTPDYVYFDYDPLRQRVKTTFHYWYCDDCGYPDMPSGGGGELPVQDSVVGPGGGAGSDAAGGGGGGDCPNCTKYWHDDATYFIFDQFGNCVAEYNGTSLARKYYFAGGSRLAMRDVASGSKLYYVLGDQVASTRVLVQATNDAQAGKLAAWSDFYPYGQTRQASLTVDPRYAFGGHRYHTEGAVNIYYLGARFYDASAMRFISPDPAGQYPSPYIYGGGNPMVGIDPNGEAFFLPLTILSAFYAFIGQYSQAGGGLEALAKGTFAAGLAVGLSFMAQDISRVSAVLSGAVGSVGFDALTGQSPVINVGVGRYSLAAQRWEWNDLSGGFVSDVSSISNAAAVYSDLERGYFEWTATQEQRDFVHDREWMRFLNGPAGEDATYQPMDPADFVSARTVGSPDRGLAKWFAFAQKGVKMHKENQRIAWWHGALDATTEGELWRSHWDRIWNGAFGGVGAVFHIAFEGLYHDFPPSRAWAFGADVAYSSRYLIAR